MKTETVREFYIRSIYHKLSWTEIYELFRLIDDGLSDELMEEMAKDCRIWFPDEFKRQDQGKVSK